MSDTQTPENPLAVLKQALAELSHCVFAGPEWFTKGKSGQQAHARMWVDRGMKAIAILEQQREGQVEE